MAVVVHPSLGDLDRGIHASPSAGMGSLLKQQPHPPESAASRAAAAAAAAGKPMKPPAQCSYCGMTFRKLEHCQRHERTHTLDRPYACSVCAKTFARQDTLNRHVRLHTRSDEGGVPSKPRRRRIKSLSTAHAPAPPTGGDASPPSASSTTSLPLPPAPAPAPSLQSRRNSERHPMFATGFDEHAVERAGRERGFSLSAVEDVRAHHPALWHDHRPPFPAAHEEPFQRRAALAIPETEEPGGCHTSLLAQYPLAAPAVASRPALFISTAGATATVPNGLPTAPAAINGTGWTVPWSYPSPATSIGPLHYRSHSMGPGTDTYADIEHPLLAKASSMTLASGVSDGDASDAASLHPAIGVAAVAPNAFGLSGVAAGHHHHHPPTLAEEPTHLLHAASPDWTRYIGPGDARSMLGDPNDDYITPSPAPPFDAGGHMDADGASPPYSSTGSSIGASQPGTGFLRNGSLPGGPGAWDVAEPMLVHGGGGGCGGDSGTESSLASSLRTDAEPGVPHGWFWGDARRRKGDGDDEDPTLASAELAQSLSAQGAGAYAGAGAYDDVGGGVAATAPGMPHMGMPNALSYLAFERPHRPQHHPGPGDHPALRLGEAVDEWRRMFHVRNPHVADHGGSPMFVDAAGLPARRVSGDFADGAPFLPLLDPDGHNRDGGSFCAMSGVEGDDASPFLGEGFIRGEPQVAVHVLRSPAPSEPGEGGTDRRRTQAWPLTPDASPVCDGAHHHHHQLVDVVAPPPPPLGQ